MYKAERKEYRIQYVDEDNSFTIPILILWSNEEFFEDEIWFSSTIGWNNRIEDISYQNKDVQKKFDDFVNYVNELDIFDIFGQMQDNELKKINFKEGNILFSS